MSNEQQTQQADDPSGDGWAWVAKGDTVRQGDMWRSGACSWCTAERVGETVQYNAQYRRRIEQPQPSDSDPAIDYKQCVQALQQIAQLADTGSRAHKERFCPNGEGDGIANGWRVAEAMRDVANNVVGGVNLQQPSDSEPETMDDLRRRLAECEVLLAEADRGGQQVNAELQQLRKELMTSQYLAEMSRRQVADEAGKIEQLKSQLRDAVEARQKAERELKDKNDTYQLCLQNHYKAGQRSAIDKLQTWLRPVLELVAEHPEDASPLAVAVLGFLPGIASRLIEE